MGYQPKTYNRNGRSFDRDRDRDRERGYDSDRAYDTAGGKGYETTLEEGTNRELGKGVLEITDKGYGFLRQQRFNYRATPGDIFVGKDIIRHGGLRTGVEIEGYVQPPTKRKGGPRLDKIVKINGHSQDDYSAIKQFNNYIAVDPHERFKLETAEDPKLEMRALDIICPIGKGQRALIVASPRSGKTVLMQQIANSIAENHPETDLFILLVDERPEEVTEFRRQCPKAEVVASNNDNDLANHIRVAEFTIERAKRLAEFGHDVVIMLDSLTRLGRAYNRYVENSGRTMTGGVDIRALETPKKQFGAARKMEEGGSLTIIATALIETGSRMDDLIFEEFKGTGNCEIVLDRRLAEKRVWPAINIPGSGTRKEELLVEPWELPKIDTLRRFLSELSAEEEMPQLLKALEKFPNNEKFLRQLDSRE